MDDIVFYDPRKLYEYADKGAAILLAKPNLPFGRVQMQNTYVTRFEQKPQLDFYVSASHYVFKTSVIKHNFPEEATWDFKLSKPLRINACSGDAHNGVWLTINTLKDLIKVREYFKQHNNIKNRRITL